MYSPLEYEPPVYRPPSEWRSLLLQVTIGCSNNKCTYCDMYRSKTYRVRTINEILKDIHRCKVSGLEPEKIFLCDGDALGAPMEILERVLITLKESFPNVRSIGVYATAQNIIEKTDDELKRLKELGLSIAYLGLESGCDKVLHMIVKGNTSNEMVEASLKIKSHGIKLSTIVMIGVGGQKWSESHQIETTKVLSKTCPQYLSFLTTFAVPETPYYRMVKRGILKPLTVKELYKEMFYLIKHSHFELNPVIFRANHVSNQMPMKGTLPKDQKMLSKLLEDAFHRCPEGTFPIPPYQM